MTRKRKALVFAAFAAAVFMFVSIARSSSAQAQAQHPNPPGAAPTKAAPKATGNVERGRYIVEDVAYCTNCHTPRTTGTNFDRSHWLQGGPLFWQPAHPVPNFPQLVPRIGGTPPATDAQMVTLLTTGLWTDGKPLRAPMPPFHMTKEDAEAVVAYLKTVNSAQ
ncbi:MAG: c-type cytochrome [Terriglobales bacterium]